MWRPVAVRLSRINSYMLLYLLPFRYSLGTWKYNNQPSNQWSSAETIDILCGNVYMYVSGKKNIRAIESPPVQLYIAIFELVVPFDHMIMPWKLSDYISNSSGVTCWWSDTQTDSTDNIITLATWVVNKLRCCMVYCWHLLNQTARIKQCSNKLYSLPH